MSPLTALAVVNNATNIAFTLAASMIIARVSESSCLCGLLEQEATNRHRFSFSHRPLRGATESSPQGTAISAFGPAAKRGAAESVDPVESNES
jgi:hypothetical protein